MAACHGRRRCARGHDVVFILKYIPVILIIYFKIYSGDTTSWPHVMGGGDARAAMM
eukprot:SAG31_NODE_7244_length_1744_cov_30.006687_2_plen_56_part_00